MCKALFVPLQLTLGIFVCLSTRPILAEARLALGEETESYVLRTRFANGLVPRSPKGLTSCRKSFRASQPPSFLAQITPDNTPINTQVNQNGNVAEITGEYNYQLSSNFRFGNKTCYK